MLDFMFRPHNDIVKVGLETTWRPCGLSDILRPTKGFAMVVIEVAAISCVSVGAYKIARRLYAAWTDRGERTSVTAVPCASVLWRAFCKFHDTANVRAYWQRDMSLPKVAKTPGHSHGDSAKMRTAASICIDAFAAALNRQVYVVSSSARDDPAAPTYHQWYIEKDLAFKPRNDQVPGRAVIKMVDVDYYVEWSEWLRHCQPVAIYTFVPDDVMYTCAEYSYSLRKHGVIMDVSGGRRYDHAIWDYSCDYVLVWTRWNAWTLCSVDSKQVDRHHRMVLINPVCTVKWFGWLLPIRHFARRCYQAGRHLANVYRTTEGDQVSIGLSEGGVAQTTATLPLPLWAAIRIRVASSKHPNISDVERYLRYHNTDNAAICAPSVFQVSKDLGPYSALPAAVHGAGAIAPLRYQHAGPIVSEDGKEIGRCVGPPLVTNPDVVPNRSYNNDFASVSGRVTKVLNDVEPPARYLEYARTFIDLLVDRKCVGVPLELQEVVELQNRPAQRGRSNKVLHWIGATNPVSVRAFMKGETYQKPTDPRNISTVGAEHTIRLSAYTYAFKKDVLYPKVWYAPGKRPADVADRIAELAMSFDVISETDFSRFDGTISAWLRTHVERPAYISWVTEESRADLESLLLAEINPRACTSHGLAYQPKSSRLSGSPLTTDGNTIINAFVSYAAAREAGLDPKKAFALLGIYAGDDGVSPVKPEYLEKAAGCLGLALKCERRVEGNLTFLGRVFYGAGAGEVGSIQDPMRTWRKLHYSFAPNSVSKGQALANRAVGYLSLDPNAPVVSDWCRKIISLSWVEGKITEVDAPHYAWMASQYFEFGGWPQLTYEKGLEAIAWREDISCDEIRQLVRKINAAERIGQLAELWDNPPTPETANPVVVSGLLRGVAGSNVSINTAVVSRRPARHQRARRKEGPPLDVPRREALGRIVRGGRR